MPTPGCAIKHIIVCFGSVTEQHDSYRTTTSAGKRQIRWIINGSERDENSNIQPTFRGRFESNQMIAVTGMHRSGTSCIAGLLLRCGFSLGTKHPVINTPCPENSKGHAENAYAVKLNEMVLTDAGGSWMQPPDHGRIKDAAHRYADQFRVFSDTFDGDIFKDPRTSLTISSWTEQCPELRAIVYIFRNPLAVARSLNRRNGLPLAHGLALWYTYNSRFLDAEIGIPRFYLNYDAFSNSVDSILGGLLPKLGKELSPEDLQIRIRSFYSEKLNHDPDKQRTLYNKIPKEIREIHEVLLSLV